MITLAAFKAHAILLGERINTRNLATQERIATTPLMLPCGEGGSVILTRFGALVFFAVSSVERERFLTSLGGAVAGAYETPLEEILEVRVDSAGSDTCNVDHTLVRDASAERLQLIADVLAKSLVLELYERQLTTAFDQIEPLARRLHRRLRRSYRLGELTAHIGNALLTEQRMVGRVEIREKPEVLWEHPELEGLYLRLFDEYELAERSLAVEQKLGLITRTTEILLRLEESRRSLRAEWYIILLILIEIVLTLYEMFFRH